MDLQHSKRHYQLPGEELVGHKVEAQDHHDDYHIDIPLN